MPGALGVDDFFKNPDLVRSLTAGWRYREITVSASEVSFVAPAGAPGDARMFDPIWTFTSPATQRTRILNGTIPVMKLRTSASAEIVGTSIVALTRGSPSKKLIVKEICRFGYAPWTFLALADQYNSQLNSAIHLNFDDGAQVEDLQPSETIIFMLTNQTGLLSTTNCVLTVGLYFQDTSA